MRSKLAFYKRSRGSFSIWKEQPYHVVEIGELYKFGDKPVDTKYAHGFSFHGQSWLTIEELENLLTSIKDTLANEPSNFTGFDF